MSESIRIGLAKHVSLFRDIHFVANDLLKLNNEIKACLINLNIILYYVYSLSIGEYFQHYQHQ